MCILIFGLATLHYSKEYYLIALYLGHRSNFGWLKSLTLKWDRVILKKKFGFLLKLPKVGVVINRHSTGIVDIVQA